MSPDIAQIENLLGVYGYERKEVDAESGRRRYHSESGAVVDVWMGRKRRTIGVQHTPGGRMAYRRVYTLAELDDFLSK